MSTMTRRYFFERVGAGFLGAAIGYLWTHDGLITSSTGADKEEGPLGQIAPRLPVRVNSVIFLFMCGGVSHIDTFDPKDNGHAGKMIDAVGFGDNQAKMLRPVIPILRTYTRYGKSSIAVSDWFPHVGSCVDDIAFVHSMYTEEVNHFPAVIEMVTGHRGRQFTHPCLGSWVSYALGSANKNLPAFVNIGRASSPVQLTGGYLGATVAATPFQAGETPIPNLYPPKGSSPAERDRQMQMLLEMNKEFRERFAINTDIQARSQAYELAANMQLHAPEAVDFSQEPQHVLDLYGIGEKPTDDFGRQLLLARRLAERGARFIQLCRAGGGNGSWDAHGDMKTHEPL